ncbi:hypothetical protein OAC13_01585 [bacterium]|nr:hypothetical protein [bacterium]
MISIDEWIYLYHIKKIHMVEYWIPSFFYFYIYRIPLYFENWYYLSKCLNVLIWIGSNIAFYRLTRQQVLYAHHWKYLVILVCPTIFYLKTFTPEILSVSLLLIVLGIIFSSQKTYILYFLLPALVLTKITAAIILLPLIIVYRNDLRILLPASVSILCLLVAKLISSTAGSGYVEVLSLPSTSLMLSALPHALLYFLIIYFYIPPSINYKIPNQKQKQFINFVYLYGLILIPIVTYFTVSANYYENINYINFHSRYLQPLLVSVLSLHILLQPVTLNITEKNVFLVLWIACNSAVVILGIGTAIYFYIHLGISPLHRFPMPLAAFVFENITAILFCSITYVLGMLLTLWRRNYAHYTTTLIVIFSFGVMSQIFSKEELSPAYIASIIFKELIPDGAAVSFKGSDIVDEIRFSFFMDEQNISNFSFEGDSNYIILLGSDIDSCENVLSSVDMFSLCKSLSINKHLE